MPPFVCVVAPAGYGKTTLLAQWAERTGRRVAWVSVDQRDNDPVVLLSYLAAALDRVEPIDPAVFQGLGSPGAAILATVVPRLGAAVSHMTEPVALVLDHVELLDNSRLCREAARQARHHPRAVPGVSTLTTAELRLLPLLATHLKLFEIGQRLYLSKHTVKTQAVSIYRKLGVSSRSQAVQRLQEIGLLEGWSWPVDLQSDRWHARSELAIRAPGVSVWASWLDGLDAAGNSPRAGDARSRTAAQDCGRGSP